MNKSQGLKKSLSNILEEIVFLNISHVSEQKTPQHILIFLLFFQHTQLTRTEDFLSHCL